MKQISKTIELGAFKVTVTTFNNSRKNKSKLSTINIATRDDAWRITLKENSTPFYYVSKFIEMGATEELLVIIQLMYKSTTLIMTDMQFVELNVRSLLDYDTLLGSTLNQITKEEDDAILKEEQAKHEFEIQSLSADSVK